jgi:hypothetical protein
VLLLFRYVYVKCTVLRIGQGVQLTICGCCSWETDSRRTLCYISVRRRLLTDVGVRVARKGGCIPHSNVLTFLMATLACGRNNPSRGNKGRGGLRLSNGFARKGLRESARILCPLRTGSLHKAIIWLHINLHFLHNGVKLSLPHTSVSQGGQCACFPGV